MRDEIDDPYYHKPINIIDDIPIFSMPDDYVNNYKAIAKDHLNSVTNNLDNPWIENEVWEAMENSTLEHIRDITTRYNDNIKILDVGVGLGRFMKKVQDSLEINADYYGIDISIEYLRVAKQKNISVAYSKIEDMPYKEEYFDIITCTDVLEHVQDLNYCISQMLKCLKKGGIMVVRVPNREDLTPYLQVDYPYEFAHLRSFDQNSLQLLFTRVFKLKIIDMSDALIIENNNLLKYYLPFKGYRYLLNKALKIIKYLTLDIYKIILAKLYHATEINVVLQK